MGTKTVEAWVCDKCGHVWIKGEKPPVSCAKCKTRRWNDSAKPRRSRASLQMPQWSEAKLRKMAKAEEGFIGAGATPYNLAMQAIADAQTATYTAVDSQAGSRAAVHAANQARYPGHAAGCECFRCRMVKP